MDCKRCKNRKAEYVVPVENVRVMTCARCYRALMENFPELAMAASILENGRVKKWA